jgi:hypothetical protein
VRVVSSTYGADAISGIIVSTVVRLVCFEVLLESLSRGDEVKCAV